MAHGRQCLAVRGVLPNKAPQLTGPLAARLGVEPIGIASEHAVFAVRPRELAAVLVG